VKRINNILIVIELMAWKGGKGRVVSAHTLEPQILECFELFRTFCVLQRVILNYFFYFYTVTEDNSITYYTSPRKISRYVIHIHTSKSHYMQHTIKYFGVLNFFY